MLVLLSVMGSSTATVIDVTKTHILVSDTNGKDSIKLKHAFAQILANNTGEQLLTILQNPVISEVNISSGVKRSYFEKIDTKYLSDTAVDKYWFHVVMDEKFIQKIIANAGFSLLPHNRDEIMLWLVKEGKVELDNDLESSTEDFDLQILNYAQNDEVLNYWLQHWANALGLVVVMPEYDEIDMLLVTPESIKNLSFEAVEQSIMRYTKNQSLLVYVKHTAEGLKVRTGYTIDKNDMLIKHFQTSLVAPIVESSSDEIQQQIVPEPGELIFTVMSDVADNYANYFRVNIDDLEKHTTRFVIESIDSYDEINDIKQYLASLSMIDSYEIVAASHGQLVITANLSITNESILQIVQRDGFLQYNQNSPINQLTFYVIKDTYIEL